MTSIRRKLFFLLAALLALPMQAQVNLVYVDSARVARLLAEDAGLVAAPVAEVADTDTVPLADRPVVADGADFDRLWTDSFADRMAAGLYGCPCLYLMPRTNHDKNKFVLLKRKFEPYWIDKYYQKGGKLYE